MYESFFGLRVKPFDLLPNPTFLYQSRSHKRAMTYLDYGIKARSGFILVTGEIGSGKTTIIRDLIKKKMPNVVLSKVFNTKVSSGQLISMINDDFGLPVQGKDKIELLRDLNEFLINQFAKGMQPVLIVDEAQNLSPELLEEVRMLSNLETDQAKLLQIILVGQPELKRILATPDMLQLRQRISINCHIQPLTEEETQAYILHRLEKAGDRQAAAFTPEVFALIHAHSRGVPRLINIICDFLMLSMFSAETRSIDGPAALEILQELDFDAQFWETREEKNNGPRGSGEAAAHAELNRTKVKLTSILKDITQRIDLLERNAARFNESMTLDLVERVNALETSLREVAANMDHLRPAASPGRGEQEAGPARPVEEVGHGERLEEITEDQPDRERKGFFRRLFSR